MSQFQWWNLFPANELLVQQPGDSMFNHFVSVVKSRDYSTVLAYIPHPETVQLRNPQGITYQARWFDPVKNRYQKACSIEKAMG